MATENLLEGYCTRPWEYDIEPFKIIGDTYYVGNKYVGCYLIDSGDGLILIDTAFPQTVYLLFEGIRRLGFDPRDIKLILITHAHYDHCGGVRMIQEYTGAKVYVGKEELPVLNEKRELLFTEGYQYSEFNIDGYYDEDKPVILGNISIRTIHTPGHTAGTYSFFYKQKENGNEYNCGLQGGLGLITFLDSMIEKYDLPVSLRYDYINSLEKIKDMHIDVVIPSHPNQNNLFAKLKIEREGENPFINKNEWKELMGSRIAQAKDVIKNSKYTDKLLPKELSEGETAVYADRS